MGLHPDKIHPEHESEGEVELRHQFDSDLDEIRQGIVEMGSAKQRRNLFNLGQAHVFRVADDGHHQAAFGGHRDADILVVVVDDLIALDRGVDYRELA